MPGKKQLQYSYSTGFLFCLLLLCTTISQKISAQSLTIKNDAFWYSKEGLPVNSQGGGVFKFFDSVTKEKKYFWYGVHYKEADLYRNDPTRIYDNCSFESVTCYSSSDLVNWKFEGDVLTKDELAKHDSGHKKWVGRLGVAYLQELQQYALFVQHGNKVLVTVSDKPAGNFTWHREIDMSSWIGTSNTGDQTVFTDEDNGKSYLVYCNGRGRNKTYISEIGVKDGMVSLLDHTLVFQGENREGNCMFKYKGMYYLCASNIYGWDASLPYYLASPDIRGPYQAERGMLVMNGAEADYGHVTQTGFFISVKGSKQETIVYCGDRWADFAGNGIGYNQWFPLSFDGNAPYFNSLGSWNLDAVTGEWEVAADNNYVKNGSFEADRKNIPSAVKPVQTQLTGWFSKVTAGNTISTDSIASPVLNHNNSEADRKTVIGEKSLQLSDKVDFKRKVFQVISSSPYVTLKKGKYILSAKIRNSSGFSKLEMYASSGKKIFNYSINKENADWQTIEIKHIPVKGGKIEIGFIGEGKAGSYCYVDDVSLIKE